MIYPDEYKCLVCKKYYSYACKHRQISGMLSCSDFKRDQVRPKKIADIRLYRCFFGCCPACLFTFKMN